MASIEIRGIEKLKRKFSSMQINDILRPPMQRSVMILQAALAKYPTQRPGSTYRRTGTLGRAWTTSVNNQSGKLVGRVGNNVVYVPFVQSSKFQRPYNRRRWQTDEQVVEQNRSRIIKQFDDAIARALED